MNIDKPTRHIAIPNLLQFISMEQENLLVSVANRRRALDICAKLDGLYQTALAATEIKDSQIVVKQLLFFTHYHYLFAAAALMRCHMSEALASTRCAIDGALVAAVLIDDPSVQEAYVERTKPFDKLNRHLKNLIRDNKPLPHRLVPALIDIFDRISAVASHADVSSFIHRVSIEDEEARRVMYLNYFQLPEGDDSMRIYDLNVFQSFVMVLDVFSDYLIKEIGVVTDTWKAAVFRLGAELERERGEIQKRLKERDAPASDVNEGDQQVHD